MFRTIDLITSVFICYVSLVSIGIAQSNEVIEVKQKYGFNESSNYQTLLAALSRAYSDQADNPHDKDATAAIMLASQYASGQDEIRLILDFWLPKNIPEVNKKSVRRISQYIENGGKIDDELGTALCDRICVNLSRIDTRDSTSRSISRYSTDVLLALKDERGARALFSNHAYIKNIMREDNWNMETDLAVFEELAQKFGSIESPKPFEAKKAALYEILHERKLANLPLVPEVSGINWGNLF